MGQTGRAWSAWRHAATDPGVLVLQITWWAAGILSIVFIIIWPVLVIPAGVFNLGYFSL